MTDPTTGNAQPGDTDPLAMAMNCVAAVRRAAELQASPDPDVQIKAHIAGVGTQGAHNAQLAAQLALVSIAADIRRLADDAMQTTGAASAPGSEEHHL